ncbi:MAG: swr1 complex component [Chrysothrix sp. TS-e1954]|nr:MAG: swr1 complex component [Chrysothrix sp. TS-e1954]
MFLIEDKTRAILYTGDIRSEAWWVGSICRHPSLIPYTSAAALRRLDAIYLDTTFAIKKSPYLDFPTKAAGITELLRKLTAYPSDTVYYFHNWTFGYEDVLLTLSKALHTPIHLDAYRYRMYESLVKKCGLGLECREAASLCGFQLGNTLQPGIFTCDSAVRLHSCEKGADCPVLAIENVGKVVHIIPMVSRHGNVDIEEIGAGGGKGDLNQMHELDLSDNKLIEQLRAFCTQKISDEHIKTNIDSVLEKVLVENRKVLMLEREHDESLMQHAFFDEETLPLEKAVTIISRLASDTVLLTKKDSPRSCDGERALPLSVRFPYSRHSSYNELRLLVAAFQPTEIVPCTEPSLEDWNESRSMEYLFGDLYDLPIEGFRWDRTMRNSAEMQHQLDENRLSQATTEDEHEIANTQNLQREVDAGLRGKGVCIRSDSEGVRPRARVFSQGTRGLEPATRSPTHDTHGLAVIDTEASVPNDQRQYQDGSQSRPLIVDVKHNAHLRLRKRKTAHRAAGNGEWTGSLLTSTKEHQRSTDSLEL